MNKGSLKDIALDVSLCHRAIAGEMKIYEVAKAILDNHPNPEDPWDLSIPDTDFFGFLVGYVESHVPQGAVRQLWNPEALAQRDQLKLEIEIWYQEKAFCAFQSIIDHWQPWLDSEHQ